MAERRMAEIVRQSKCLGVILVQADRDGNRPGDLRHLDGMSQTVSEMIAKACGEDLCFAFHPTKRSRMDDAVAVALKVAAVGMNGLGKLPATQICAAKTDVRQRVQA